MTKLPEVSWREVVKALSEYGFIFDRQRGSHMVYYHPHTQATATIPKHSSIKKGTLVHILKQAGLTREEFIKLVQKR